jgi:hypothetical protein
VKKPCTIAEYVDALNPERREPLTRLITTIRDNLPAGFEEIIGYGMPSWVVPHSLYPAGYHVDPKLPLPFLAVASQKRHIGLYHMGLYASPPLLDWFIGAYPDHCKTKLDMGKSCVRLKNPAKIPYELVGILCTKMTPSQWIECYETAVKGA